MIKSLPVSLIALACSFITIQCSPLVVVSTTTTDDHAPTTAETPINNKDQALNKNAFAVILSSISEIVNTTAPCQHNSTQEPLRLNQSDINENLALTYTLASDLLSYNATPNFDFLVFVDSSISSHQRRHLRQIGVQVHQIKAATQQPREDQLHKHSLKCANIPSKEDSIRSSNDINVSDYEKMVLLDPKVIASPRLLNVFDDVRARSLMSDYDSSNGQHTTGSTLTSAMEEVTESLTFGVLTWMQYLLGSVSASIVHQQQHIKASTSTLTRPVEMFPRRENLVLQKPAITTLNHYAATEKVLNREAGYTIWEMCLD